MSEGGREEVTRKQRHNVYWYGYRESCKNSSRNLIHKLSFIFDWFKTIQIISTRSVHPD